MTSGSAPYAAVHADALAVLRAWPAPDPSQAALRNDYLDHLGAHPDALAKGGPPAHLTIGCLVLDPSGTRILLTHHRRAGAWYQFGGHVEGTDPGLRAAATRELVEESGLSGLEPSPEPVHLDRHALPASFGGCREHLDVRYAALAPADAVPVVSAESYDVRWWDVADLDPDTRADLDGLITAARAALGLPR